MTNPNITPATGVPMEALHAAMLEAFSDYAVPMQLSLGQFSEMMGQRSLDLASSRVAKVDGEVAAIWLTGIRDDRAYLISSGTRPAYRSRGLARALAEDNIAHLRRVGMRSFQTEVLRNNETAAALYLSLGMEKARLLDCYSIPARDQAPSEAFQFSEAPWAEIAPQAGDLFDWQPSWQNDAQSLDAVADQLLCLTLFDGRELAGFAATHRGTGTIPQIAVRRDRRRQRIATALVQETQARLPELALRLINIDGGDPGFRAFVERIGGDEIIGQFELKMAL